MLKKYYAKKNAIYLIICTFFCSTLLFDSSLSFAIPTQDWLGLLFASATITIALFIIISSGVIVVPNILILALLHLLLVITAAIFADDFNSDIRWEWYGYALGFFWLFALAQLRLNNKDLDTIIFAFIVIGLIHAILAILQYHKLYFGITTPFDIITANNATSAFYQTNYLASYLVTTLIFIMLIANKLPQISYYLILLSSAIMAYALGLTQSKTGLFILIISTILIIISNHRAPNTFIVNKWHWLFAIICGYLLALYIEPSIIKDVQALADITTIKRLAMYGASINLFLEEPLTGNGLGTFTKNFLNYYSATIDTEGIHKTITTHPHNQLLYRLTESGIVGTLGLICLAAFIIYSIIKQKCLIYLALILPLIIHSQVEFPLHNSIYSWLLLLFIIYLITYKFSYTLTININLVLAKILKLLGMALLLISIFFLVDKINKSVLLAELITSKKINATMQAELYPDSYFANIAKRLTPIDHLYSIKNITAINGTKLLAKLNDIYKYFPMPQYYIAQAIILARMNKFNESLTKIKQLNYYYPKSHNIKVTNFVATRAINYYIKNNECPDFLLNDFAPYYNNKLLSLKINNKCL